MDDDPLESNEYYRDRPTKVQRKHKTGTLESGVDPGEISCKSTNTVELLPVVLRRQTERKLKSFNPIYVDNCLKNALVRTSPAFHSKMAIWWSLVPIRNKSKR